MEFLPVSIKKLNALIDNPRFVKISSVEDGRIQIEYDDGRVCEIDAWGRVTWLTECLTLNLESKNHEAEG